MRSRITRQTSSACSRLRPEAISVIRSRRLRAIPAIHGVVRWRLIDLSQWIYEEFRITVASPVIEDAPVTNPPREAFALLNAPVQEVSVTPLPVKAKRKIAKRAPPSRWTAYRPAARAEALPAGW